MSRNMTRREMLAGTTAMALGGVASAQAFAGQSSDNSARTFTEARATLRKWLADCTAKSRIGRRQ